MNTIIEFPAAGVAIRPNKKRGTALIAATLNQLGPSLQVAEHCRRDLQDHTAMMLLTSADSLDARHLEIATAMQSKMLARAAAIKMAYAALLQIFVPPVRNVSHPAALAMLSTLFGALAKARSGDLKALLTACADMFAPGADDIGETLGLWKPINRHPAILAIAVKKLIATSIFSPAPSELRTAMQDAREKMSVLAGYAGQWLTLLDTADCIAFAHDRDGWLLAYQRVRADVVAAMLDSAECDGSDERTQALAQLAKQIEGRK